MNVYSETTVQVHHGNTDNSGYLPSIIYGILQTSLLIISKTPLLDYPMSSRTYQLSTMYPTSISLLTAPPTALLVCSNILSGPGVSGAANSQAPPNRGAQHRNTLEALVLWQTMVSLQPTRLIDWESSRILSNMHWLNKKGKSYAWGPKMTPLLRFLWYLIFENWHLEVKVKLKMSKLCQVTFSISPLPLHGVLFNFDFTFTIYGLLLKKFRLRFLIYWVLTDLASCIASILKTLKTFYAIR